uniref:Uncharacterized protein n=1 Tax=Solanum tuberosum TaxID=4113 RepID=M1DF53_SOLTU
MRDAPFEEDTNLHENINSHTRKTISLNRQDKERLHSPWKFSLIVKLMGKRMIHHYLKSKITELWKSTENFHGEKKPSLPGSQAAARDCSSKSWLPDDETVDFDQKSASYRHPYARNLFLLPSQA